MDTDDYTLPIPDDVIAKAASLTAELMANSPAMSLRCLAAKAVRLFFCPCVTCDGTCGYSGEKGIHSAVVDEVVRLAEARHAAARQG